MAFIPVLDTALVVIHQRLDGQLVENTLGFLHFSGPPGVVDLADLATGVGDYWGVNMLPLLSTSLTMEFVSARDLSFQEAMQAESISGQGAGGVGGAVLPNNVAACIAFHTALTGRSNHGRNYIAGIPEASVVGNTINTDLLVGLSTAYDGMKGPGTLASGWTWVIISRFHNGAARPEGITNEVTSAFFTDGVVDSQRRRLPGRGN
jgi:hypothetical protein